MNEQVRAIISNFCAAKVCNTACILHASITQAIKWYQSLHLTLSEKVNKHHFPESQTVPLKIIWEVIQVMSLIWAEAVWTTLEKMNRCLPKPKILKFRRKWVTQPEQSMHSQDVWEKDEPARKYTSEELYMNQTSQFFCLCEEQKWIITVQLDFSVAILWPQTTKL